MDFDLFSCTFENLNNLKFNELQKLSSQFRVNKRWAKKREIIEKLLSLRDQEISKKKFISDKVEKNASSEDNLQWIDANEILSSAPLDVPDNDETDRRLTYNVSNPAEDVVDRRLTFNVVKNEGNQTVMRDVNIESYGNIDRRLTYNADELKKIQISQKNPTENKVEEVQELVSLEKSKNATNQPEKGDHSSYDPKKELLVTNGHNKNVHVNMNTDGKVLEAAHSQTGKNTRSKFAKAKMLTIPYSRLSTQSRKSTIKEVQGSEIVKAKLPEKISGAIGLIKSKIAISKPLNALQQQHQQHSDNLRSINKSVNDQKNTVSIAKTNLPDAALKCEMSRLNYARKIPPRRKSKTEDNVLVTNLRSTRNLKFFSPTESDLKNRRRLSEPNKLHQDMNLRSKIPKAKPLVEIQKPAATKKMPNFSKIHQRQFEQMDSLLDYKRKKEERAKKLFGIPQPGIPVKVTKGNVATTVFQFKSSQNEKENKLQNETIKPLPIDAKRQKEKPNRQDMVNHGGSKPNIVTNLKEQNRTHLKGVRMNKRFELQMKCRKI